MNAYETWTIQEEKVPYVSLEYKKCTNSSPYIGSFAHVKADSLNDRLSRDMTSTSHLDNSSPIYAYNECSGHQWQHYIMVSKRFPRKKIYQFVLIIFHQNKN